MKQHISAFEAYAATYEFLGQYYDTVQNDTLGAVLASMRLKRETKLPVNPALKSDWLKTAGISGTETGDFTGEQAYALMAEFLRRISAQLAAPGLKEVIAYIALHEHDAVTLANWEAAIELAEGRYEEWE